MDARVQPRADDDPGRAGRHHPLEAAPLNLPPPSTEDHMPKFTATFAGNVRAYAAVSVEAADPDVALRRFREIAEAMARGDTPPEVAETVFTADWDQLAEVEFVEELGIE